jgi:predicted Zn-dependent peptidase
MVRARLVPVLLVACSTAAAACGEAPPPAPRPPTARTTPVAPPAAPAPLATTPDAEFRKAAPAPGPRVTFVAPKIEEARLKNGIRVLVVPRNDLPIVAVQLVVAQGADQGTPGLGGFVGAMLMAGTKTRSALVLSDELEALGARYGAWIDYDGAFVRGECLAPKLPKLLELLADVVQNPAFDEAEIERERSRRLTAIAQQNDRPATLMSLAMNEALYPGKHPYATPVIGDAESVQKIAKKDLAAFHAQRFAPDATTIAVAGDVKKDALLADLEKAFGAWKGASKKRAGVAEPPAPGKKDARVIVVDRPGTTQSNVVVALPGVARKHKDFDAMLVMNTILGGQFSSRLNLNLREKHAYTYGARSGFDWRVGPGPFSAGGAIHTDKTEPAVREILKELDRIQREPVTDEELADAKANLVQQLPGRFETAADTAGTIAALSLYGLPLDEFATRAARIEKVTKEDIQRVAKDRFLKDRMRVVIAGDAGVFKDKLATLDMGTVAIKQPPKAPEPASKPAGGGDKPPAPSKP